MKYRAINLRIFLGIFSILLLSNLCLATNYYIAINGNNNNNGLTENTAFRTIQYAAGIIQPGDSCIVLPGTYNERAEILISGNENAPIVFAGRSGAITKGFKIRADFIHIVNFEMVENGVSVRGKFCQVINNTIKNLGFVGIDLISEPQYADNATVSNCRIEGNTITYAVKCGIRVMGQNHIIEENEISHTLECSPYSSYCDDADGIRFFGSGHIIRKNHIFDILHEPENLTDPHIDMFQTWKTARNIIFEQNLCVSPNTSGSNQIVMISEEPGEIVENIIFRNNIFVMSDPGYCPLNIHQKRADDWIENIQIVNNTFIHRNLNGMGEYAIRMIRVKNATVKNNITLDFGNGSNYNNYITLEDCENVDIGTNLIYTTNGIAPRGGPFPGDLWMINPQLMNLQNGNYQLTAGSPAIDAGVNLQIVTNDFAGNPRPAGSEFDIGAYEFSGTANLPPAPPANVRISPGGN